jgi:hypothetical protein
MQSVKGWLKVRILPGPLIKGDTWVIYPQMWRKHYNTIRPYSALGYRPPVPAATLSSLYIFRKLD